MKVLKFTYLLIFFSLVATSSKSQVAEEPFSHNKFIWQHETNGSLFANQTDGVAGLHIIDSDTIPIVYSSSLWIAGLSPDQLVGAASTHCTNDCAFQPGPLTLQTAQTFEEVEVQFDRIWYVTREQIETHIEYYECLNDEDCDTEVEFPNGYEIPEAIETWPAMGDTELGFAQYLAPFVDTDNNGVYNPENGDYPDICGDFCIYQIYNDKVFNMLQSIGVEIHTSTYGYESDSEALSNTLFMHHRIYNRGTQTLNSTRLGIWNDFDIGNYSDDYVGTDVARSMVYAYNGDSFDEDNLGTSGFGDDLGIVGMRILAGPTSDFDGEDNSYISEEYGSYANQTIGWGDAIVDNERLGLSGSISFGGTSPINGSPSTPLHFYNFLTNRWKNNDILTFGGPGFGVTSTPASYIFPGESDPLMIGTNGEDPEYNDGAAWTESEAGIQPGDRQVLASSGEFTLGPGDVQNFTVAYIFARDSYSESQTPLETLQQFADEVEPYLCETEPLITSIDEPETNQLNVSVFPNPTSDLINIELDGTNNGTIELLDLTGKVIVSEVFQSNQSTLDLSGEARGIYLLKVQSDGLVRTFKIVKE
ncbi:T9SS type A sorting domain-containing protein [Halocola ammonii]